MNAMYMALKLKKMPELHQLIKDLYYSNTDEKLKLSLMSPEEKEILEKARNAHHKVQTAVEKATEAIPRPAYSDLPLPEFTALLKQRDDLETQCNEIGRIFNAVRELKVWGSFGKNELAELINLDILASKLIPILNALPNPTYGELQTIERSIENKSRSGTKVTKIMAEKYAEYDQQIRPLKSKVTAKEEAKYAELFAEEDRIKQLIYSRTEEKMKPIREQMQAILEQAMKDI